MEVFVVRLWPGELPLRGRVEHVASGEVATFVGPEHLLGFLASCGQGGGEGAEDVAKPSDSASRP